MDEASAPGQEISFMVIIKAVLKKWLMIGFLVIFGALIAAVYVLAAMPLSKDVYQMNIYLNQVNVSGELIIYNENNINNIKNYISSECEAKVFNKIKDNIFSGTAEPKKERAFKDAVKISVDPFISIYVIDREFEDAKAILNTFADEIQNYVTDLMSDMIVQVGADEVFRISATSSGIFKSDPDKISVKGYVRQSDRIIAIVAGALAGAVIGVAIAVCVYFFNNKPNSVQLISAAGLQPVYVDSGAKGGGYSAAPYDENAVRYGYLIEKEEGCRTVGFICPKKTAETAHVLEMHAASMRKYGHRVKVINQENQTRAEWEKLLSDAEKEFDYILIDTVEASNYDCAIACELCDGVVAVIGQKNTSMKAVKHMKEVADTARLKLLSVFVTDTRSDFIK